MDNREIDFRFLKILIVVFFIIILAFAVAFQLKMNKNTAVKSCDVMVTQLEELFAANDEKINSMTDTLKEEYIVRANAVAYILENGKKTGYTVAEYKKIAGLLNIDEIHIFSPQGKIIEGTNPEYVNYSFDSGKQMAFFKPMLNDFNLSMCQDVTPNTAEKKMMMYAITWMSNRQGMIQVGITPERLLNEKKNRSVEDFISDLPIVSGMGVYVYNTKKKEPVETSDADATEDTWVQIFDKTGSDTVSVNEKKNFVAYKNYDDYCLAVTMDAQTANEGVARNTLILLLCLAAAYMIIVYTMRKSLANINSSQKKLAETNDIIYANNIGIWRVGLGENGKPYITGDDKIREIFGADKNMSESLYDYWHSRIDKEAVFEVKTFLEEVKKGEKAEITYRWMHPQYGEQYIRCGGKGEREKSGDIIRGYCYNVTEEVRKEEQYKRELADAMMGAQKANDAKTVFLSNMSHDIRTPLNAIIGFTDIAISNADNAEKLMSSLLKTKKSGEMLLNLVNDILDLGSIENGSSVIHEEAVSLISILGEIKPAVSGSASAKNIELTFEEPDIKNTRVYADKTRLFRILINILNNAVKYTQNNGFVKVSLKQKECDAEGTGLYEFVIEDNGRGMSKEFQEHLFERFARETDESSQYESGTGLGLAATKAFVDAMNGSISVESEKGKGSVFTVDIPFRFADETQQNEENSYKTNSEILDGMKILIVEDNELNREIVETVLSGYGAICDEATDGMHCLEKLAEAGSEYYDLILMDIRMPVMNGHEATRKIREIYKDRHIPVIALSANAFEEDRRLSEQCGMDGHITKPIVTQELLKVIAETVIR